MNTKELKFDSELHKHMLHGAKQVSTAVCSTMGAHGGLVCIEMKDGLHRTTKDGVSVADNLKFPNPYEDMGASIIIDSAMSTVGKVGDGTTTTVLLSVNLYDKALALLETKSILTIKNQIQKEKEFVLDEIKKITKKKTSSDTLKKIALVSSNHDHEIANIVSKIYSTIGASGIVNVKEAEDSGTRFAISNGFVIPQGWYNRVFCNKGNEFSAGESCVFVTNHEITQLKSISSIFKKPLEEGKAVIIMAKSFSNDCLASILANRKHSGALILPIEKPSMGNSDRIDEELSILSGATFFDMAQYKLEEANSSHLGTVKSVVSTFEKTTIEISDHLIPEIEKYATSLEEEQKAIESRFLKRKYTERIARVRGKIATIHVGADLSTELKYKLDVYDDCLKAVKSCLTHGYVAGGGVTYMRLANMLKHKFGEDSILYEILKTPVSRMLQNAGYVYDDENMFDRVGCSINRMQDKMLSAGYPFGYNLLKLKDETNYDDDMVDMLKEGIIEPANLPAACIENACSAAIILISTKAGIAIIPEI